MTLPILLRSFLSSFPLSICFSSVLLHELGHLLHIKATGTLTDVPDSFKEHLLGLGIDCRKLTTAQLQELFADTFMLAVVCRQPELGMPKP